MKNILLVSGGLDSTVLLFELLTKYKSTDITAIFFNYGQKSYEREKQAINKITKENNVELLKIDLQDIFKFSNSRLVKHNNAPITEMIITGNRREYVSRNTEVEFRNGVFISIAVSLAQQLYPKEKVSIFYGAIETRENLADCSLVFCEYMNLLSKYSTDALVEIKAPFINKGKDEVLKLAYKLGVPIENTWSCYVGEITPCGICPACFDKRLLGVESANR